MKQNIDPRQKYGWNELICAVADNRVTLTKALLQNGVDPNHRDNTGNSALIWAVRFNNFSIAEILVTAGCDLDLLNYDNKSALSFAAENGNEEIVDLLLQNNVKLNLYSAKDCAVDRSRYLETTKIIDEKYQRIAEKIANHSQSLLPPKPSVSPKITPKTSRPKTAHLEKQNHENLPEISAGKKYAHLNDYIPLFTKSNSNKSL